MSVFVFLFLMVGAGTYLNHNLIEPSTFPDWLIAIGFLSLLWLLTLKTITITEESIVIKWVFLQKKEEYHFNEIEKVGYEEYKLEAHIDEDGSKVTIHDGWRKNIYLKSGRKPIRLTTYHYSNYLTLVRTLKKARKRYKTNLQKEKSNQRKKSR